MATYLPLYRLTLYAPRIEDATELTVLSPIAGAAHSDPFVVTTLQGITGAKPYLEPPKGRQGSIDPVTRKLSAGNLSVEVFDARTTVGGANASRWVTAFVGDAQGRTRLKGCRAVLERSLDGTAASLTPYFAGRVRNVTLSGPQRLSLELADGVDDLSRLAFLGLPHASVTYAGMASLIPVKPPIAFENIPASPLLTGTLVYDFSLGTTSFGHININPTNDKLSRLITKFTHDAVVSGQTPRIVASGAFSGLLRWETRLPAPEIVIDGALASHRAYDTISVSSLLPLLGTGTVTIAGGAGAATFTQSQAGAISNGTIIYIAGLAYTVSAFSGTTACTLSGAPNLSAVSFYVPDPRAVAIPGGSTQLSFYGTVDQAPVASVPLLIGDVHPVQLMADIIDGKYSTTSNYPTLRPLVSRDTSGGGPWATLLADPSFGVCRFIIDKSWKANDFIEQQICQPFGLAYAMDAQGRVVPIDLRRSASRTPVTAFTDADLSTSTEPAWADSRNGAITAVEFHAYVDRMLTAVEIGNFTELYPDIPTTMIGTTDQTLFRVNDLSTLRDVGEKIVKIDAQGLRVGSKETDATGQLRASQLAKDVEATIADFLAPFQSGTLKHKLSYRLTSAGNVSVGQFVTADHTKIPNPATNQRGGARLALVIGRSESGGEVALDLLDFGAAAGAAVPAITSVAINSTNSSLLDVTVTANAAGDQVAVWECVTDTSIVVRPLDTADAWTQGGVIVGAGVVRCGPFPAGKRVWLRARSQAIGVAANAPSGWVYPSPGYLDLPAITVSLTVTPDPADGSRCTLAWTLSTPLATDVYVRLTSATVNPAPVALLKGSTGYVIEGLTASTNYTVTLNHRDAAGAIAATQTATFTTSANVPLLAAPVVPTVFAGPQFNPLAANDGTYGLAVVAMVLPGSVEFREAVETSVGSGVYGTATSIALVPAILGDWTSIVRIAPNDGLRRQLSARSLRGATNSVWTTAIAVQPWTVVKLPVYSGPLVPRLQPFTYVDTETTRVFSWTRNVATVAVWVYDNLVSVGGTDPYDIAGTFPTVVLAAGTDTYTAQKPPANAQRFVHFVPYDVNNLPGDIRHEPIDPAPSALSGTVKVAVNNGTADLTLHIAGGASNWPVAVDLFEDNPDGAAIYSTSVSAVTDILPAGIAALTARPLPLRELRRWYLRLTDVAGVKVWGIGSADRNALPNGSVTASDLKPLPSLTSTYDDDTDSIRVTTPTGKTKTVSGLRGSGQWTYTVGDVLDDASVETALIPGETRTPYVVEFHGGGIWVPFYNGPLHGAAILALVGRARVTATSATLVTVRYAVADPIPQGANSATITYQDQGSGGVTPSSGGTVTPAATITEAAGTYIDYTITRPAFGAGTARVTFTTTAAGRVSDSDAVDVPEQQTMALSLSVGNCTASNAGVVGPPWNQLVVAFTATGFPTGTTFDVSYNNGIDGGTDSTNVSASPATFTGVTFGTVGAPGNPAGRGAVTVVAKLPTGSTATAIKNKPYLT